MNVTSSATASLAVKVTTPLAWVLFGFVEMIWALLPSFGTSLDALHRTGARCRRESSTTVAVIVVVVEPLAGTFDGVAVTVAVCADVGCAPASVAAATATATTRIERIRTLIARYPATAGSASAGDTATGSFGATSLS